MFAVSHPFLMNLRLACWCSPELGVGGSNPSGRAIQQRISSSSVFEPTAYFNASPAWEPTRTGSLSLPRATFIFTEINCWQKISSRFII